MPALDWDGHSKICSNTRLKLFQITRFRRDAPSCYISYCVFKRERETWANLSSLCSLSLDSLPFPSVPESQQFPPRMRKEMEKGRNESVLLTDVGDRRKF